MPRMKRASDEVYNERRRQRRELERQKRSGTITKEGAMRVERQIEKSYMKKRVSAKQAAFGLKGTLQQIKALSQSKAALAQERRTSHNFRSDKVMEISMRAAHKKSGTSKRIADVFNSVMEEQGLETRAKATDAGALMRIFWTSTQRAWQTGKYDANGKPMHATPNDRLELIKKRLGVKTIEEALRMAFAVNAESLERYMENGYGSDEESTARYPDFLHWVEYVYAG